MRTIVSVEGSRVRTKRVKSNQIFTIRKIKNQKKWTREEDELLISLAEQYNEKHWKEISKRFMKKNSLQCFSRYKRIRPGIVKGSWKKEEDLKIIDLVSKYGKSWSKISKLLGTRNGKQIRDRFINVLDPEIRKGKFTEEEDLKLVALFKQYGPKWATIAKYYPNRTADMIKNRFHSSIKKKLTGDAGEKDLNLLKVIYLFQILLLFKNFLIYSNLPNFVLVLLNSSLELNFLLFFPHFSYFFYVNANKNFN